MKKIDLHLHTISTLSDTHFEFSLEKLQEYINTMEIDCIAITNHNHFNKQQYEVVTSSVTIKVLPGIEVNLEGGHILVIADTDDVEDFSEKCIKVEAEIQDKDSFLSLDRFYAIFNNLSKYILIPHYDKRPIIRQDILVKLKEFVFCGEVTSIRKFKSCLKEVDALVPVLFSDMRFCNEMGPFSTKQTFIDIDDLSINAIKSCLFNKSKVFLSKEDGNELFQVTADGLKISTGLNIVFGERSTGKTFTLDKICEAFENVKYIKQFSLLQDDASKFESLMSIRHSRISENFLKELKDVIDDVSNVDLKSNDLCLENYIASLLKFANENDKEDTFSKTALFSESLYREVRTDGLRKLIDATILLIDNIEYREMIENRITMSNLRSLVVDLMEKYVQTEELNLKKKWVNELVGTIQEELRFRTNCTYPEDIDFYKVVFDNKRVEKYSYIVNKVKQPREVERMEIRGFKIVANVRAFFNATELKNKSKRRLSFMEAYTHYEKPYDYLQTLKSIDLEPTEYYKFIAEIEYKTLNKHNYPVSGGERSEFNLLHEISDALKHDLLLLDEPESSFDNIFLKREVNELIKDIAKEIPVIVVTHNSTVGASINPDYILYTKKTIEPEGVKYHIYSGYPSSKELLSPSGEKISNFDAMMNCLEAGFQAYTDRRTKNYEILKN